MNNFDELLKQLGRNIKAERVRRGLSQEKLAERFGCDRNHISKIECGTQNLSFKKIVQVANALDISISDILRF